MIYKYTEVHEEVELEGKPTGGYIMVDYNRKGSTHTLKLIDANIRYPIYGIEALLNAPKRELQIINGRGKHGLIKGKDFFVLYPYRIGKPFLFEVQR